MFDMDMRGTVQIAESLSFQTVLGLEGHGQSLMNEISIGVQSLRS